MKILNVNFTSKYLTKKGIHLPIVECLFVQFEKKLNIFEIFNFLTILARQKNGKIETPKSQLGSWPGVKSVPPGERARFFPRINAIKFLGT